MRARRKLLYLFGKWVVPKKLVCKNPALLLMHLVHYYCHLKGHL